RASRCPSARRRAASPRSGAVPGARRRPRRQPRFPPPPAAATGCRPSSGHGRRPAKPGSVSYLWFLPLLDSACLPLLRPGDGQPNVNGGPAADRCVNLEHPPKQFDSLLHSKQAKALSADAPASRLGKVEAGTVVVDDNVHLVLALPQVDPD